MPHLAHLVRLIHDRIHPLLHQHLRLAAGTLAGISLAGLATWLIVRARRPSAEEIERRRREHLALHGRITDGVILDTRTLHGEDCLSSHPEVLVYTYRLAGVTYNCAQDVSTLPDRVHNVRLDQSVQLRYEPRNPGNSILVSETWSGLWQSNRP